jgi:hypothetical protein
MADDWDTTRVGGRHWRKDTEINHFCKVDQRAHWLGYPGQTSDRTDWHGSQGVFRLLRDRHGGTRRRAPQCC